MPGSYIVFEKSRTPPSAVFYNSSLYFIKFKIVRASVLFIDASPNRFYLLIEAVSFYSSHFVNAAVKHIWVFHMKYEK